MTETERTYEVDALLLGRYEVDSLDEDQEPAPKADETPMIIPVTYSLDVIERLIKRLQEL